MVTFTWTRESLTRHSDLRPIPSVAPTSGDCTAMLGDWLTAGDPCRAVEEAGSRDWVCGAALADSSPDLSAPIINHRTSVSVGFVSNRFIFSICKAIMSKIWQ